MHRHTGSISSWVAAALLFAVTASHAYGPGGGENAPEEQKGIPEANDVAMPDGGEVDAQAADEPTEFSADDSTDEQSGDEPPSDELPDAASDDSDGEDGFDDEE